MNTNSQHFAKQKLTFADFATTTIIVNSIAGLGRTLKQTSPAKQSTLVREGNASSFTLVKSVKVSAPQSNMSQLQDSPANQYVQ